MKQWYKVIDVARCHDCNNCFMADKDEFVGNDWPGYTYAQPRHGHRWVDILRRERGQYARNDVAYLPVPCQQCEEAPCIEASDGAISRRDDGIVLIDMEKAKGQKDLVQSCPYHAIWWNEEKDVPQKCIFCAHLLDDPSWTPSTTRCAHSCPTEAMATYLVEPEEMEQKIAAEKLQAYLPGLGTRPHTLYKNLYRYTLDFITAGVLVDGDCCEGATVTLTSKEGGIACDAAGCGLADGGDTAHLATRITNFFGEFKFDGLEHGEYELEVDADGKKYAATVLVDDSKNLGFIEL